MGKITSHNKTYIRETQPKHHSKSRKCNLTEPGFRQKRNQMQEKEIKMIKIGKANYSSFSDNMILCIREHKYSNRNFCE